MCEGVADPLPVASAFAAGVSPENRPLFDAKGFAGAPPHVFDPGERLKAQDQDDVVAEVIYPTFGMYLFGIDDPNLQRACFRAYNDWIYEYSSYEPQRLVSAALISLEDVSEGIAELDRVISRGTQTVMIWAEAPTNAPYSDPRYDPFWARVQEADVKIALHILTGRHDSGVSFYADNMVLQSSLLHQQVERTLGTFVLLGVLERFPRLTLVSAENDVAWLPYLMWRMDRMHRRLHAMCPIKLSMSPSDYIHRQVYATYIEEPLFTRTLDVFSNVMWSSDFPHGASSWPHSQTFVREILRDVPETLAQEIAYGTAARLYGIKQHAIIEPAPLQ